MKKVFYDYYNLLFILLVGIVFRIFGLYFPFWGLEYEDSYIYSAVSRQMNLNYSFNQDILFTKYIIFGDIKSGTLTQTISGHFAFFPAFLSLVNILFGYNTFNVIYLNLILSIINIYFTCKTLNLLVKNKTSQLFFGLLYASVPFLSIYNTSGLSETASSVFVIIAIYFYIKNSIEDKNRKHTLLYIVFVLLAFIIKRDNLVLLILPIIHLIKYIYSFENSLKKKVLIFGGATVSVFIILIIFKVDKTILDERNDINYSPFRLEYFYTLFPVFFGSLFNMRFFGQFFLLLITSIFIIKKSKFYTIVLITIALMYMLIYSFHYRSYYMVNGNYTPNIIDTFRYYTNFFSICFIGFSVTIFNVFDIFINKNKKIITLAILIFVMINFYNNYQIRDDFSSIEYNERIKPIIESLKAISNNDIIVTDRPILFQMFGKEDLFVVDITSISIKELKILDDIKKNKNIYYMKDEEVDDRYIIKKYYEKNNNFIFIKRLSSHYLLLKSK
jgi:hypothetical protein